MTGSANEEITNSCYTGVLGSGKNKANMLDYLKFLWAMKDIDFSAVLKEYRRDSRLDLYAPTVATLFDIITTELSGCNSVVVGFGGRSKSLLPASGVVAVTHYTKMITFNIAKITFIDQLLNIINAMIVGRGSFEVSKNVDDWLLNGKTMLTDIGDIFQDLDKGVCKESNRWMLNDTKRFFDVFSPTEDILLKPKEEF